MLLFSGCVFNGYELQRYRFIEGEQIKGGAVGGWRYQPPDFNT